MKKKNYILFIFISAILYSCDNDVPVEIIKEPINFRLIDSEPAWSPAGNWIAFYHKDSLASKSGIYLISPDGTNIKKWHYGIAESPAWSSDGEWITFSENAQIWKKKLNGDSLTQLTNDGRNFFPSWSYNNEWIIFDCWNSNTFKFYGIFIVRNNGNEKTLFKYEINEGDIRMPIWVDSTTVIYVRYSPLFYSTEIFSTKINSESELRLTFNNAVEYYPKVSNNKIAFISKHQSKSYFSIWTMDIDGSNLKQITVEESYACDWSPNGKHIVYTDARMANGRLWIMDANGGNKRQLTYNYHFTNF